MIMIMDTLARSRAIISFEPPGFHNNAQTLLSLAILALKVDGDASSRY